MNIVIKYTSLKRCRHGSLTSTITIYFVDVNKTDELTSCLKFLKDILDSIIWFGTINIFEPPVVDPVNLCELCLKVSTNVSSLCTTGTRYSVFDEYINLEYLNALIDEYFNLNLFLPLMSLVVEGTIESMITFEK